MYKLLERIEIQIVCNVNSLKNVLNKKMVSLLDKFRAITAQDNLYSYLNYT